MTVIYEAGYTLPGGDQPLTHARIMHSGTWLSGTPNAGTTATGYFEDAPNNSLTYEKWKPNSITAPWEFDLGSAKEVTCCCIAGHNLADTGCSIRVHYWDGGAWVAKSPTTAITSNAPIMIIMEPFTAQLWRIFVTIGTPPTISVIRFGNLLQLPRPTLGGHMPIDYGRQETIRGNRSETGEFLGRSVQRHQFATELSWQNIDYSWITANLPALQTAIASEPFFIAWRPDKDGMVAYGQSDAAPQVAFQGMRDLMSLDLGMRALAYD